MQTTGLNDALQVRRKLRTAEAAEYTTVSESTLTKLRLTGGGPIFIKVGKSVLYDVSDLDAWLASHRRRSTSSNAEAA